MKLDVEITIENTDNLEQLVKILRGIEGFDVISNVIIEGRLKV